MKTLKMILIIALLLMASYMFWNIFHPHKFREINSSTTSWNQSLLRKHMFQKRIKRYGNTELCWAGKITGKKDSLYYVDINNNQQVDLIALSKLNLHTGDSVLGIEKDKHVIIQMIK